MYIDELNIIIRCFEKQVINSSNKKLKLDSLCE